MKDWYQPDAIWAALGITTRNEYAQRHVFEAHFHVGVPEDVVRAYATASQLMAQAWHHYPLYDEAVSKLLFTMEMAIKLRCEQVSITLSNTTSTGRYRPKTLQTLLEELAHLEPSKAQQLQQPLQHVRSLRNYYAHPTEYSHGGIMLRHHIPPLLNLLNFLFITEATAAQALIYTTHLRQWCQALGTGLLSLGWQGKNLILTRALPVRALLVAGHWRVIWYFEPLLSNVFATISRQQYSPPLLLCVTTREHVKVSALLGQEMQSGQTVTLASASPAITAELLPRYHADYQRAAALDRQVVESVQQAEAARLTEELIYTCFWQA